MSQSLTAFADLIAGARRTAVHFEARDVYDAEGERDGLAAWRAGRRLDEADRESWWRPWLDLVQETTGRGVAMRRIRVISTPPSEYIRYEHSFTFTNVAAGEDVRWLSRDDASDLLLPGNDLWLFDERIVQFNIFDGDGRWTRTDQTGDPETVARLAAGVEAVWRRGTPHEKFRL